MRFFNSFLISFLACTLFLTSCNEPEIVLNETVTITPDSLTIPKGDFLMWQLKATITDSDCDSVIWSSENPRIAIVDERGYVTPKNKGITYIVATLINGKAYAKCKVTVKDDNDYKFRLTLKDKGTTGFS
ncbi:MAG: Ig-like domain-containing protein, partial [Paludibacter sp.]|nr:Ig-like domain-containing protein [Paludibacter sp.]